MSELFSDEFLSAYLDGELSPQERAAVERWIERAPEARQRLEEFRGLSRLFGDLSRTEVPREFPTEVMHLAERRMLLPEAVAAHGRQPIRGWTLALTATAAVGLLLALTLLNVDVPAPGARGFARNNLPGPAPEMAAPAKPPAKGEQTNVQIAQDERLPLPAEPAGAGRGMPPPAVAPSGLTGGLAAGAAPSAGASKAKPTATDSPPSETIDSDRQLQAIHAAVQKIRESGAADKYLLVVRARAVDRADGLVLLQKDFAANNIRVDAQDAGEDKAGVAGRSRSETNSEGLYIEAEADDMIAGFKTTLARRHPGVKFFVEPSIELAALDLESQKNLLRGGFEQSVGDVSRGDDAAKEAKDSDAKSSTKSPSSSSTRKNSTAITRASPQSGPGRIERHARVPLPGKNDKDADENDSPATSDGKQTANFARQMIVPVVPPAIQNRGRSSGDENSVAEKALADKRRDEKSSDAKPPASDRENLDNRSPVLVRMLIVIESEPQQPETPAAKKEPSGGAS